MNITSDARFALKIEATVSLATPLLLRSGQTGDITDSAIERTPEPNGRLHVNGYVWASLLRRSLARIKGCDDLAAQVGKYQDKGGVSPLWCEPAVAELHATAVNPGIAIDRKWGATKVGALYNDELAIAGLPLTLRLTLFGPDKGTIERWQNALLAALRLIDGGVENIGGGWTYGYGTLHVNGVKVAILGLSDSAHRKKLWAWDEIDWVEKTLDAGLPETKSPVTAVTVTARVAPGQLMAVKSGVFPLDAPKFGKLPDWFVFRRNRWDSAADKQVQEPVIPGKAIRQALLSVPLERKWRSLGEKACFPSEKGGCGCRRCRLFGSTDGAGIIAVTDAPVTGCSTEVISRVQLCEHSMQNMNLFSGEYLMGGEFTFRIIIDGTRAEDASDLVNEILELLDEMKGETAPPGWYRLGGTATCTGQVQVIDYTIKGGTQP
jgi:hypothetical protein